MIELYQILEVVEAKKIGNLYRALCPFHSDQGTPNLTIYPFSESFYCFSCQEYGNFDKLFCKVSGIDYRQWKRENKILDLTKRQVDFKDALELVASRLFYQELQKDKTQFSILLEKMRQFDKEVSTLSVDETSLGVVIDKYFKSG